MKKGNIHTIKDKGFDKNPQNINKEGRPKKIYTVIKQMGYGADDIKTAFGELAFYSLKELKKIHDDETKPIITRIIANQFFMALKKSDWNKIKEILEHVIGKPQSTIDLSLTEKREYKLTDDQVKYISEKYKNEI